MNLVAIAIKAIPVFIFFHKQHSTSPYIKKVTPIPIKSPRFPVNIPNKDSAAIVPMLITIME